MGKPKQSPKTTLRTKHAELQAKLDQLHQLADADNIDGFVAAFVPLDLSLDDLAFYKEQLKDNADMWQNLKWEIKTIATGLGVRRIDDSGEDVVVFTFDLRNSDGSAEIDREVTFIRTEGDWRAEG